MVDYNSTREEIEASGADTAVLPIGSTEQHGPHLPVSTDFLIAEKVAAAVSERIGAYLLPVLPISTCSEHKGSKGTVWMKINTFHTLVKDIAMCLKDQGFRRLILVISHGGVFIAGPSVRDINSENDGFKIIRADITGVLRPSDTDGILESSDNLHACEFETSLMLYFDESLVRKDRIEDSVPCVPRDFLNYVPLPKLSKNGVWGHPSLADAGKGERLFNLMVQRTVEYIESVNSILEK